MNNSIKTATLEKYRDEARKELEAAERMLKNCQEQLEAARIVCEAYDVILGKKSSETMRATTDLKEVFAAIQR